MKILTKIVLVSTSLLFTACGGSSSSSAQQTATPIPLADICKNKETAYIESQAFVKIKLKYPKTAIFQDGPDEHAYLGNCTHYFISAVDAQNAFGTYRTYSFEVEVRYSESRGLWLSSGSEAELW